LNIPPSSRLGCIRWLLELRIVMPRKTSAFSLLIPTSDLRPPTCALPRLPLILAPSGCHSRDFVWMCQYITFNKDSTNLQCMALHVTKLSMYTSIVSSTTSSSAAPGGGRGTNEPPAHLDCLELAQYYRKYISYP
jgi:hypothetical protein